MSRGSVRSVSRKPDVDCCDGAPRGMSRDSIRSAKCIKVTLEETRRSHSGIKQSGNLLLASLILYICCQIIHVE